MVSNKCMLSLLRKCRSPFQHVAINIWGIVLCVDLHSALFFEVWSSGVKLFISFLAMCAVRRVFTPRSNIGFTILKSIFVDSSRVKVYRIRGIFSYGGIGVVNCLIWLPFSQSTLQPPTVVLQDINEVALRYRIQKKCVCSGLSGKHSISNSYSCVPVTLGPACWKIARGAIFSGHVSASRLLVALGRGHW